MRVTGYLNFIAALYFLDRRLYGISQGQRHPRAERDPANAI